ncbi:MAG: homoserine dehydrogenase, partial [Pseudoxanthomonas sp.]|nr:homoserine dehydrogenase [Pseudoxanthomonas sp.]
ATAPAGDADGLLDLLDAPLAEHLHRARTEGATLRFVGRFDAQGASVGLRALPHGHPLCGGHGTDNQVAIFSDRYRVQPLVIQGPGAGAEVTAAALLDEVLRISARTGRD